MESKHIFISYARHDGRSLALRLQSDLTNIGYEVWLDSTDIAGGASWTTEIEDAIEGCDLALALLTEGSYRSEICRAEQLRVLRKNKRLIPILGQANAERPLHLEHLNYRDFTDDERYSGQFKQLLQDIDAGTLISLPTQYRQTYVTNAPTLPSHYIARPSELEDLRRAIIRKENSSKQAAVVALSGMGGTGKSVLASALCGDEVVQAAFHDGVIWVTVGPKPTNLIEQMQVVGKALGSSAENFTSEQASINQLRAVLPLKSALIVLDDVWDAHHVEIFQANAPKCCIVFTTRDQNIPLSLGAPTLKVGMLPDAQAIALLREWAKRDDPALAEINRWLRGLPLALKVAGAHLSEGTSGEEWLKHFQHVFQIKLGHRSIKPNDNLQVCFDLSLEQMKDEDKFLYYTLSIFPEDIWIPEQVIKKLWKYMKPTLTDFDCHEILVELHRLALIEKDTKEQTITLHGLLRDYASENLGDQYIPIHESLLKAYNSQALPWYQIPNDGYLYNFLTYHLRETDRHEELYALLPTSPDWLDAKFKVSHDYSSFVADLAMGINSLANSTTPEAIDLRFQLYAVWKIISGRTKEYSQQDLKTLVWLGQAAEACEYARLCFNPADKGERLQAIHEALVEKGQPSLPLLYELEQTTQDIQNRKRKNPILAYVAAALYRAKQYERADVVVDQLLEEMKIDDDAGIHTNLLKQLVIQLAQAGQFDLVTEFINFIRDEEEQLEATVVLETELFLRGRGTETQLLSRPILLSGYRGRLEVAKITWLARQQKFDEALDILQNIDARKHQDQAWVVLVEELSRAKDYDKAELFAENILDEGLKAQAQTTLLTYGLRDNLISFETYVATLMPEYVSSDLDLKARRLRIIAQELARVGLTEKASVVLEQARRATKEISRIYTRARVLCNLGSVLYKLNLASESNLIFKAAEQAITQIAEEDLYLKALEVLIEHLLKSERYGDARRIANKVNLRDKGKEAFVRTLAMISAALKNSAREQQNMEELEEEGNKVRNDLETFVNGLSTAHPLVHYPIQLAQAGLLDIAAIYTEMGIKETRDRAEAFLSIAEGYFFADDEVQSNKYHVIAAKTASNIKFVGLREELRFKSIILKVGIVHKMTKTMERLSPKKDHTEEWDIVDKTLQGVYIDINRDFSNQMLDNQTKDKLLCYLVKVLVEMGRITDTYDLLNEMQSSDEAYEAKSTVAKVLIGKQHLDTALKIVEIFEIDDFIQFVAEAVLLIKTLSPESALQIIQNVIRIAGWDYPDWQEIYTG